jgi:hypothetical protein
LDSGRVVADKATVDFFQQALPDAAARFIEGENQ